MFRYLPSLYVALLAGCASAPKSETPIPLAFIDQQITLKRNYANKVKTQQQITRPRLAETYNQGHVGADQVDVFNQIGGFSPLFPYSGSEDQDLYFRLQPITEIPFLFQACVKHPVTHPSVVSSAPDPLTLTNGLLLSQPDEAAVYLPLGAAD